MDETLKFAVFIDYDNIEIGVRTTLGRDLDVANILEGIKQRGEIVAKFAYGNWSHHSDATRSFSEFGVQMVQRDSTPRGDKNGADINLALDAFEMAVTRDHINAFAIVSGDSDFMSLVNKLKQYNKRVYIVGGKQFTSKILQRNCHEFISYESLLDILPGRSRRSRGGRGGAPRPRTETQPVSQLMPLVDRALNALDVRGAQPQLGLLKSTMLQLDPAFSENDYGVSSFSTLAEKLVEEGYIKVITVDNHHVVERSAEKAEAGEQEAPASEEPSPSSSSRRGRGRGRGRRSRGSSESAKTEDAPPDAEQEEEAPAEEAAADPRKRLAQLLAPHIDLLEMGIPAREVQALIKTDDANFSPSKLGFEDFTALLDFAETEELLRSIPDDRNVLRFKPGDALAAFQEQGDEEPEPKKERPVRRRRNVARRTAAKDEPADDQQEESAEAPTRKKAAKKKATRKKAAKKATRKKAAKKAASKQEDSA